MALQLLCRNDVADFGAWKKVFDADAETQRAAGLSVMQIWRDAGDANRVFFLFRVNDRKKAQAFMDDPRAGKQAEDAGVTAAEYHFLETL